MGTAAGAGGGGLKRIFGLGFGLAVVIGGVIGSGIMRNPGVVARGFPSPLLIALAWIFGALVVALDAASTVELGAAIPEDGGPYALATRALGPRVGALVGWADWLQCAISTGFIATAFGEYWIRAGLPAGQGPGWPAAGLILACGAVNALGARWGGLAQNILSAVKAAGLLALVLLFLAAGGRAAPSAPPPPAFSLAAAALALRAVYGAYGGWHSATYFSEEVRAPERNVARSTFLGIALVSGLYVLVNLAILRVLPLGAVARSSLPAADAARAVLGPGGSTVVTGLAVVAVASLVDLQIMAMVRSTFAAARRGLLPAPLARVAPNGTPLEALGLSIAAVLALVAAAAGARGALYETLLELYAPFPMFIFLMLAVGVVRLRRREPDLARPWRMPLFPVPAVIGGLVNLALLVIFLASAPATGAASLVLLLLAVPLLLRRRSPP